MAVLLCRTDRSQDAESFFEQALLEWRILGARFPRVPEYGDKLKRTCENLLRLLDQRPDQEESLQRALAIRQGTGRHVPGTGRVPRSTGSESRPPGRHSCGNNSDFRKPSVTIAARLPCGRPCRKSPPTSVRTRTTWPRRTTILAILCRDTGQTAAAADAFRQAVHVMDELAIRVRRGSRVSRIGGHDLVQPGAFARNECSRTRPRRP